MIQFPDISPEIFSIYLFGLSFSVRWYAISYLLGFFCAIKLMQFYLRRSNFWIEQNPPMTKEQADSLLTYLILGVIIGGRFGYVLFYNFSYYAANPIDALRLWDGGMAFHGGFIGVIVAGLVYYIKNKIPLLSGADIIAISSPPGLFFGRLANFVNAELWGRPTQMPWGVIFPGERAQDCVDVIGLCTRHPSQIYEALLEGLLLFIVLISLAACGGFKRPALITATFILGYGLSRFFVEYFRVPDDQFFSVDNTFGYAFKFGGYGVTMGQALSLPMICLGLFMIFYVFRAKSSL